jgi:hypothetical protein
VPSSSFFRESSRSLFFKNFSFFLVSFSAFFLFQAVEMYQVTETSKQTILSEIKQQPKQSKILSRFFSNHFQHSKFSKHFQAVKKEKRKKPRNRQLVLLWRFKSVKLLITLFARKHFSR